MHAAEESENEQRIGEIILRGIDDWKMTSGNSEPQGIIKNPNFLSGILIICGVMEFQRGWNVI